MGGEGGGGGERENRGRGGGWGEGVAQISLKQRKIFTSSHLLYLSNLEYAAFIQRALTQELNPVSTVAG